MKYLITLLDNNVKSVIYTGENIHGLYFHLETIGDPTNLTSSGQLYHHFGNSYSTYSDIETLQPVIANLRI